ncbi:MAG: MFS transporter [Eubacteriaceae bacterium]|nr:MFS transporter [Eubacteriaceae bacterium]
MKENGLTIKAQIGYGSAAIGDAVSYTLINTFILFFLTTQAGIQPAAAGLLTSIGSLWNAAINPIIGYLTDHTRTSMGRRRPFLLFFCIPMCLAMILLFSDNNFSYYGKLIYYGFMIIIYWTAYTGFYVPYSALGADYSQDYDDRIRIRLVASFFNSIGMCIGMALPMSIIDAFKGSGMTDANSWRLMALLLGVTTAITIICTFFFSKKYDVCKNLQKNEKMEPLHIGKMFKSYLQLLSLKPLRLLLVASLFYVITYAIITSDFMYYLTYNQELTAGAITLVMIGRCAANPIMLPIISKLCEKTDKKTAMLIVVAVLSACCIILRFVNIHGFLMLGIYIFIMGATCSSYWQLMPAMFYDICEYDELMTGQRREGEILAIQGLTETVAAGLGVQIMGIILQFAGFDGTVAVQSETAICWIYNNTTWIPAVFLIVAGIAIIKYPITKAVYEDIIQKIADRKDK